MRTLVLALALLVSGCARCMETCVYNDRRFEPAHVRTWTEWVCYWRDPKDGHCVVQMPVEHQDHIPDRWFLQFKDRFGAYEWYETNRQGYEVHADIRVTPDL